jgi:hypothetical protein
MKALRKSWGSIVERTFGVENLLRATDSAPRMGRHMPLWHMQSASPCHDSQLDLNQIVHQVPGEPVEKFLRAVEHIPSIDDRT